MWKVSLSVTGRLRYYVPLFSAVALGQFHASGQCTEQTNDPVHHGGDDTLLLWSSLQRSEGIALPNQLPTYSYERKVENRSKEDVTDVSWPVAGYWRKVVPAGKSLCDLVPLVGYLQVPSPRGELHYGPSASSYHTTAYAPKDGWLSSKPSATGMQTLTAELQVASRTAEGYQVCAVRLKSEVAKSPAGEGMEFRYQFSNIGPTPLRVFWSIPWSSAFRKQFKNSKEEPLALTPERTVTRVVTLNQKPALYRSTVFISDQAGELLGRSVVGVWAGENAERSPRLEDEWTENRR
jgi:hypothetical protein